MERSENIENFFNSYRKRTRNIIWLLSILTLVSIAAAVEFYIKSKDKPVYVVLSDGIYKALRAGEGYEKSDAMKRLHSRMYFELMFSANKSNYYERTNFALNLIEREEGLRIYREMKDQGVFDMYERYPNMKTEINIDSIVINNKVHPEEINVYAVQYAIYMNEGKEYDDEVHPVLIAAKFNLVDLGLDYDEEKNPLGFVIKNFDFFEYPLNKEK